VASCNICNAIKGSLVFESFAEARLHVLTELEKRNAITIEEASCKPISELACEHCGARFLSYHSRARFCSDTCRYEEWNEQNPRYSLKKKKFRGLTRAESLRAAEEALEGAAWPPRYHEPARPLSKEEKQRRKEERERRREEVKRRAEEREQEFRGHILNHALKLYGVARTTKSKEQQKWAYTVIDQECRSHPWLKEHFPWWQMPCRAMKPGVI
jgi:hypothetical protein